MPIPELDENGLLPVGIHDCSLAEIKDSFGSFALQSERDQLFERLEEYVANARLAAIVDSIIVDGSFVTDKHDPGDIDLLAVLPASHDMDAQLRPLDYNVVSRRRVQKKFHFDVLVAVSGSANYTTYLNLYQDVKDSPGLRKGVLRIVP